jgi:hypothetical protein
MKKIFVIGLFLSGLMAGPALAADSTDHKIGKDVGRLKKDYTAKVHKELKKIGAKIDQFKRDIKKGSKTAEADLNKQVKGLETQKTGVDKKLVELEKSTGDAWKDLRRGVDDAVEDLKSSVDNASRQFKQKK